MIRSPAPRLPQGSSNNLLLGSVLHFTEQAAIFTSIFEGKRVLKAYLPQNHPAGEGRAARPRLPNQPAAAAEQDASSLPPVRLSPGAEQGWEREWLERQGFFLTPSASPEKRGNVF